MLQSKKFGDRINAYGKILPWNDSFTQQTFLRNIHTYSKEKHLKVIGAMIPVLKSVFTYEPKKNYPLLNFKEFFNNFLNNLMSTARGPILNMLNSVIPIFWDFCQNKKDFKEELKNSLNSKK